jgi:dynein heavy chain
MGRVSEGIDLINIEEILGKLGEESRQPHQNSFIQECEYMNILIGKVVGCLKEIELAFKGELTMTEQMETLMNAIFLNRVPALWEKYGFVSMRPLGSWLDNLKHRLEQLWMWRDDPQPLPKVTFLNRLFNPQSFLTSIK